MFLEQQIGILERFLKDHVTLKTFQNILKYKTAILNCNSSQYYCFYWIFQKKYFKTKKKKIIK